MTESSLKIEHDIVLPPELKNAKYSTDIVQNQIELQTLDKAFVTHIATSKTSTSVGWEIPSISGGAIVRELEVEMPINFSITFKGQAPTFTNGSVAPYNAPPAVGGTMMSYTSGTSPAPFMSIANCLDQFPLSKIFSKRAYKINNSPTVLTEEFSVGQIDAMVAQLDFEKCKNAGLELFADANTHFRELSYGNGGNFTPLKWTNDNINQLNFLSNINRMVPYDATVADGVQWGDVYSRLPHYFTSPDAKFAANICNSWQQKRNTARNIVSSSVSAPTVTLKNGVVGYGSSYVPVGTNGVSGTGATYNPGTLNAVYYNGTDTTYNFTYVVREQILSQYWDHEYSYNKFSYNKILPASSLNVKFDIDSTYLKESLLKIGDNLEAIIENGSGSYSVSDVSIGDKSQCKLYLRHLKIPVALLPKDSYKVLYYAQTRGQGAKLATMNVENIDGANHNVWTATMNSINLSQVQDYLLIQMNIDKSSYMTNAIINFSPSTSSPYRLPSNFTAPITSLEITFNEDTALGTYRLDKYQLEQFTMENLQNSQQLRDLIVGQSKSVNKNSDFITQNVVWDGKLPSNGAWGDVNDMTLWLSEHMDEQLVQYTNHECSQTNGTSNSSFYLLKLGTQIRLPDGYCPGVVVGHNLSITAKFDADALNLNPRKDTLYDTLPLKYYDDNSAIGQKLINISLDVVQMSKRMFTLSADALAQVYEHNIQINSSQYLAIRNQFLANFDKYDRDSVFGTDMMLGGGMMSNIKKNIETAAGMLKKQIKGGEDDAKVASDALKGVEITGSAKYNQIAPIEGGKKRREKASNIDWAKYVDKF